MASHSQREIFSLTGPSFLTALDWSNSYHRRSVAASLVQGVYTLERDRRRINRQPQALALAPPWWQSFNFRLVQILVDTHDLSNFGAVYEFINHPHHIHINNPPRYVIAFRGTITKPGNREQDFKLNLHLILNNLQSCTRFRIALEATRQIVQHVPPGDVWLAGHSLGSSLALLVGREMAKHYGLHLETYLFNPPFASPPIHRLPNDSIKLALRLATSVLTAGLAAAVDYAGTGTGTGRRNNKPDHFVALSSWIPYLFINTSDLICSEYVGYFKHREDMELIGAGKIGRLATKHSIGTILSSVVGKRDCEAMHLIPSAYLTLNVTPSNNFKEAHGIHQWWRQDLDLEYKYYQYN